MKLKIGIIVFAISAFIAIQSFMPVENPGPRQSVLQFLADKGEALPSHYRSEPDSQLIRIGKELIFKGVSRSPQGKKGNYISLHYSCVSCHNTVREDVHLNRVDQEERLAHAMENNIPYLQGSTFWGIVNREQWYNGDYDKKYGQWLSGARNNLEEAISFCATTCAQGRELEGWEMEAILSYFSSLEYKMEDIGFEEAADLAAVNKMENEAAIKKVKSQYLTYSPATFVDEPDSKKEGYPFEGRIEQGEAIYRLGCQHCHRPHGESELVLEDNRLSANWLLNRLERGNEKSFYEAIRHGTYAHFSHRPYMPNYTEEKMSDQQVEDLRAFLEDLAK